MGTGLWAPAGRSTRVSRPDRTTVRALHSEPATTPVLLRAATGVRGAATPMRVHCTASGAPRVRTHTAARSAEVTSILGPRAIKGSPRHAATVVDSSTAAQDRTIGA